MVLDWPGSSVYMLIKERMQEGKMVVKERLRPVIVPEGVCQTRSEGLLRFDLIVLSFEF